MLSKSTVPTYLRSQQRVLSQRLAEPRRFIQVLAGPRQVGKTTIVRQALLAEVEGGIYVSADEPSPESAAWLATVWEGARDLARQRGTDGAVLVLDEVQKITDWSEAVKRLWDEDTRSGLPLKVVVTGSAPLLGQRGLTESLAGRFEVIHVPHWTYLEMREAFGFSLEDYLWFGGYPGAAALIQDPERWRRHILESVVETTLSRDVLLLTRVDKPILLRRLFDLGCRYSGQILSYSKMLGQLQDAGNTTTLAHYLQLLAAAGMLTGLQKYAGEAVRQRGSSPKLQVLDNALFTAAADREQTSAASDSEFRGRLVESAVGMHLANAAAAGDCELFYWRESSHEVDFVVRRRSRVMAIEVKSGRALARHAGLEAFAKSFAPEISLVVGTGGVELERFLSQPVASWFEHGAGA